MNNFVKGLLVGTGIGLLIAPMKGEELRHLIAERLKEIRSYLPENEQIQMYTQKISDRVSQTSDSLKGYAQQAASTMKHTASSLGETALGVASSVQRTGKDVLDTTHETLEAARKNPLGD